MVFIQGVPSGARVANLITTGCARPGSGCGKILPSSTSSNHRIPLVCRRCTALVWALRTLSAVRRTAVLVYRTQILAEDVHGTPRVVIKRVPQGVATTGQRGAWQPR